jgi:hypothetical protein
MHLAAVERDAWEHGYKAGHVEGVRKGEAELKVRIAEVDVKITALQAIIETLAKPLEELDAGIETELTRLAMIIAKHLVRRELRLDPTQVNGIVRHTVGLLPIAASNSGPYPGPAVALSQLVKYVCRSNVVRRLTPAGTPANVRLPVLSRRVPVSTFC